MMNSSEFKKWRKSQSTGMNDLTFAHPEDIFIFTRFTMHKPIESDNKEILYAESVEEAIGYIRHNFLYDILNDAIDDLEFDFKFPFDKRQEDVISLLNYWYKLGKISSKNTSIKELKEFCKKFNCDYGVRDVLGYEIQVLSGADELRLFLTKKISLNENFDKKRLSGICSKELFCGNLLKDFIDKLFN